MAIFKVTIEGGREVQSYTIIENSHNDTAVNAAITALRSYASCGLSRFPYSDGDLTLKVVEIEYEQYR